METCDLCGNENVNSDTEDTRHKTCWREWYRRSNGGLCLYCGAGNLKDDELKRNTCGKCSSGEQYSGYSGS